MISCCPCNNDTIKSKFDPNLVQLEWDNYQARLAADEVDKAVAAEHQRVLEGYRCNTVAATFYPALAVFSTTVFLWCYAHCPLVPLRLEDADWAKNWLFFAIADQQACALCLVGIVIASEDHLWGLIWGVSILILGAPFACAYLVSRVFSHGTLALLSARQPLLSNMHPDGGATIGYVTGFYVVAGFAFLLRLSWTLWRYPTPFQDDPGCASEWLITSFGSYAVTLLCLCGIILASETKGAGVVWCVTALLFSGPGACAYLTYRAVLCSSIALCNGFASQFESQLLQGVSPCTSPPTSPIDAGPMHVSVMRSLQDLQRT